MEEAHIFTNTESEQIEIYKSMVEDYRGGSEFTTIYMKDGWAHYVKESFAYVDSVLQL